MLGQSPMPSQRVVVLNAGIIYGLPVLDFSFTLLPPKSYLMQYRTWPYEFGLPLMDRFSGANYTWVKAGHQGLAILDFKIMPPLGEPANPPGGLPFSSHL